VKGRTAQREAILGNPSNHEEGTVRSKRQEVPDGFGDISYAFIFIWLRPSKLMTTGLGTGRRNAPLSARPANPNINNVETKAQLCAACKVRTRQ
jgi:hypothetical protein